MENNICKHLKEIIHKALTPLIKGDYILLDLPYYSNIGDILIWKGTETFLKELPGSCLGMHSKETFDFHPLPTNCTILLLGGGNFGDIWREHQEFRLEVMRVYPENDIIVLPQTIFYENNEVFASDITKMNMHKHLTICARDNHSAKLLKENNFKGCILTIPDMAFCIDPEKLKDSTMSSKKDTLLLMRDDKELSTISTDEIFPNAEFEDWPEIRQSGEQAWQYLMTHDDSESDKFFTQDYFPKRIEQGVKFTSSYKEVYSTRLHVAILRLLQGLPVVILDNSYGKNKNFYASWLQDSDLVSLPSADMHFKIKSLFSLKAKDKIIQSQTAEKEKIIRENSNYIEELKRQLDEERYWLKVNKDWAHSLLDEKENLNNRITSLENDLAFQRRKVKKYKRLFTAISIIAAILLLALIIVLNI